MATKSDNPLETKAAYEARLAAAQKALTETISKQDGNPKDLSWEDIARAFHLFAKMDNKAQEHYLWRHSYRHLVNDCLIDPSGHFMDFYTPKGVVEELAKEAILPPGQRTGHQLALYGSVDQSLGLLDAENQNRPLCRAGIASEKMLIEDVAEPAAAAATPTQAKPAAARKDAKKPDGR